MPDRRTQAERRAAGAGSHRPSDDDGDDDNEPMQVSGESEQADEEVDEEEVEDEEEDVTESSQSSTVQARSGITYDLAHLDPDSEARALLGLTGRFDEIHCESTQTGYDFRLSERPQVHIGSGTYTCTCSAYQSRPDVACQHIFVSFPPFSETERTRQGIGKNNSGTGMLMVCSSLQVDS